MEFKVIEYWRTRGDDIDWESTTVEANSKEEAEEVYRKDNPMPKGFYKLETKNMEENNDFKRMQELAGIDSKKNYTVSIKDNKESFNTPKEVKGYIDDVFKNTNKYLLSDVVITSKDGDRVEIHKLHQHYQDNY